MMNLSYFAGVVVREYVRARVHVLLCVFFLVYVKYMEFIVKNNLFCSVLFCSVLFCHLTNICFVHCLFMLYLFYLA